MDMTLRQIETATEGRILRGDPGLRIAGISTDTRKRVEGALFFALQGASFDAHEFLPRAARRGAAAAVVHRKNAREHALGLPIVLVEDTTRALGDLARWHRNRCTTTTVIGVTGSNGKTTVKEMLYHILNGVVRSIRSIANYNNEIGVPLTLFQMRPRDIYAVVEMGTNSPGEIARLCEIAGPDIGLITAIAATHLQGLGSVAGVAEEKAPLLRQAARRGGAFYNADDFWSRRIARNLTGTVYSFGIDNEADLRATNLRSNPAGMSFKVVGGPRLYIPIPGGHNARNALAAVAAARKLGIDWNTIAERLASFRLPSHRMQIKQVEGVTLIDDAYNANPASMRAAAKTLSRMQCRGRKVFVAGDMLELGEDSVAFHRRLGATLAGFGFDYLFGIGRHTRHLLASAAGEGMPETDLVLRESREQLAEALLAVLEPGDTVLFKASRGIRLEEVAEQIEAGLRGRAVPKPERDEAPAPRRPDLQQSHETRPHSPVGRPVG
ncbi:MAG: UDP-N-acetylmuramoyl-tripeptide--D-alanyl-D-alanine ligase [Planctomycetota bacterium]